jgi:hypothetical protein
VKTVTIDEIHAFDIDIVHFKDLHIKRGGLDEDDYRNEYFSTCLNAELLW